MYIYIYIHHVIYEYTAYVHVVHVIFFHSRAASLSDCADLQTDLPLDQKLYTIQAGSPVGMMRRRNCSYNRPMPGPTNGHRGRASSTVQKTWAAWQCANEGCEMQIAQAPHTALGDTPWPQLLQNEQRWFVRKSKDDR